MALTELGFKRRTFDEILSAKIEKAKELFGEDIETSELTPLGKYIRINAYDQALTEEEAEQIYYSIFPNTAIGTSLDRLCVFVGISRNAATKAKYIVKLTGTAGKVVPMGFLVGTESNINFSTVEDVAFDENGTITATVECVESGEIGNVLVQEINTIINPSADVDSVIGESLIFKGEETESDYDLRKRFNSTIEGVGSSSEAAIKAALLRVPTVTHAGIIVNDTDETDENGRPPRSFECFVNGGDDYYKEIAETIFEKKPIGIKTYGTIAQEIIDSGGFPHIINFSHTTNAPVYVRISIITNAEFAGDKAKKEIKDNVADYIDSIGIGNSIIYTSLYGKIYNVTGVVEVTELQLSTNGTEWFASNITVDTYESCVCMEVQIKQNAETDYLNSNSEYEVIS